MTCDKLGSTITAWRVQAKKYPQVDPGLVSDFYGFDDSPRAEVIARGISGKGPESAAIARHGNFLLWGYSAAPGDMTPEGRKCFINSVCYIKQFDGQGPLVRRKASSRRWALRYANLPRMLGEEYKRVEAARLRLALEEIPHWLPKKYSGDVNKYVREHVDGLEKGIRSAVERILPKDLRKRFGDNADKYIEYYTANLEYP